MFFLYMLLVIALMVVISVVLTKTTVKVMGKLGGEAIYNMHQSVEFIMNTGLVPPFWREKAEKRLNRLREGSTPEEILRRVERRVRRRYLRQLKSLLKFAENTSTVEDEETRDTLLTTLNDAYRKWRKMSWKDMTGS